jgi:hypothetical protein
VCAQCLPTGTLTLDINFTVLCVCGQIVQAREQQLNQSANELKLSLVQQRFPNENLNLDQTIEVIEVWRRREERGREKEREGERERGGSVCVRACMRVCVCDRERSFYYNSISRQSYLSILLLYPATEQAVQGVCQQCQQAPKASEVWKLWTIVHGSYRWITNGQKTEGQSRLCQRGTCQDCHIGKLSF